MDYAAALNPHSILKPAWLSSPDVITFKEVLALAGIDLVFSGGAVRDAILDIHARPKDFDVFANATADRVQKALAAQGFRAEITATGKVIAYLNESVFDIFNLPAAGEDAAPWLSPQSLRDKVLNFEFSINTLVLRPDGTLYDFFGAIPDILEKRVRFLVDPMVSIARNILSRVLLRYVRFCVQFGDSQADEYALEACKHYKKGLSDPSQKQDLSKNAYALLLAPYAAEVLPALQQHDLFRDVFGIETSLTPIKAFSQMEHHAAPSQKLVGRIAALLLGKRDPQQGLAELAEHLELPEGTQKRVHSLLQLLPYVEPGMSREKRLALIETLGASLDMLLMLRGAAEGEGEHAKEMYLNLMRSFNGDGYMAPHLAAQYVVVRGGQAPYGLEYAYGFTLIELSIVLVIIGLIVGGILVGRDLIHAAEIRSAVSQIEKYNAAVMTFTGKYNCLPGDCTLQQAQQFGFTTTDVSGICGTYPGDGDGNIGISTQDSNGSNCSSAEVAQFWQHLKDAKLMSELAIPLNYNGSGRINAGAQIKFASLSPYSFMGGSHLAGGISVTPGSVITMTGHASAAQQRMTGNHLFWFTGAVEQALDAPQREGASILLPADAAALDTKLDDGLPESGIALAGGNWTLDPPTGDVASALKCVNTSSSPHSYNFSVKTFTDADGVCSLTIKSVF